MRKDYKKRWNKCFIHDKVMPEYIYKCINFAMYFIDMWYYFLLLVMRLRTKQIKKKYYLSVCAIFKDESLSMREWIEYHHLIGVDHFYLYNNNSTDRSVEILQPYIERGLVTLINWKMPPPCQAEAYNHCKEHFYDESNWIAFIDLDEYICPRRMMNMKEWLEPYESYPSLVIYWKMFGSAGQVEHDPNRLITEQYYIAWDRFDDIGKPIINTRFPSKKTTLKYIHDLPSTCKLFSINFTLPPVNEFKHFVAFKSNRTNLFTIPSDFSIQINHYVTKSYMDYFVKRRNRGDVNNFKGPETSWPFIYAQNFAQVADYSIYSFLPFLKVRMSEGKFKNYFD